MLVDVADRFLGEEVGRVEEGGLLSIRGAEGVEEEEVGHDDVGEHLGEGAGGMFKADACGALGGDQFIEMAVAFGSLLEDGLETANLVGEAFGGRDFGIVSLDLFEVSARGDTLHGGDDLELAGTLIDGEDAGVAVEAFAGIFLHEATATVDLDAVVGTTVGELAGVEFDERGEDVGDTGGRLRASGEVDITSRLIHEATGTIGAGPHLAEEILDSDELVDGVTELLAGGGVSLSLAAGTLTESNRLGADAKACTIHKRHDILDKTQAAFAHNLAGGVGELEFSGRAALDTHLVFDAADRHATVSLVEDEVAKTTAVVGTLLAAGEDEVEVGVAVGDEALDTIEAPAFGFFIPGSLEADRLEVGASVGLGEVHRAGSALIDAGEIFVFEFLVGELLDGVGAVLETPDGGEAHVGASDDFGSHDSGDAREVEAVVLTVESHAVESRLDEGVEVLAGAAGILDAAVEQLRALMVDRFGVGCDDIAGDIAEEAHHHVVLLESLVGVGGSLRMAASLGEVFFLHSDDLLHIGMVQIEREVFVIEIEVHEWFTVYGLQFFMTEIGHKLFKIIFQFHHKALILK